MSPSNSNRRSGRKPETPERVENAAREMQNTGSFRGYVPQQTGSNPQLRRNVSMPAGNFPQPYDAISQMNGNRTQQGYGISAVQTKPKKKGKIWLILLVSLLAVGAIAGAVAAGIQMSKDAAERKQISDKVSPYDGLYCPNVYVDGIHLGGMTPEQALNSIQSQINQRDEAWSVQLVYEGNTVANINTNMLSMTVDQNDLKNILNEAWKPGHTGTQAERYEQMINLEKNPYFAYSARPDGDTKVIDQLLANLKQQIDQPAQDAQVLTFDTTRSYPFVFSSEIPGKSLNTAPILEQLYRMVSTMTSGTVELIPDEIQPQQTVAELEKHFSLRASATTPIDRHSTDDRNNNIRRCFQLISGTVIQPGKTFSFNKIVGPRTTENGFYPATEYINDEHVIGIGGGACQASTTVYQAAVCAGLQITSRRPHSDSVSYAAYGEDATVYMGGKQIDLVFKNNTAEPIYITADVLNDPGNRGRLMTRVNIYGADLGDVKYTLETETVETLPSIMEPVYVSDKESAAKAKDGCIVNSYRMTYVNGNLTNREFLFKDTYNPKPEKIYDPNR